jgi:hypothetical protein
LRCVFQRLDGDATPEGLWLVSTVTKSVTERFRVLATAVGRTHGESSTNFQSAASENSSLQPASAIQAQDTQPITNRRNSRLQICATSMSLSATGTVSIDGQTVRLTRPGLLEEYSVGMDGVRQDFVVMQRPAGRGELCVELDVTGAKVEATAYGAQLVLENSRRKIAYSRLRVTDATGKELSARIKVKESANAFDWAGGPVCAPTVAVLVNDADAAFPIRIDPLFSDGNWISMNPSIPGANFVVEATVVDGSGNLYIGGDFTVVGDVIANRVAKWNGSGWSALGSGVNFYVYALAVSGSDLYAGGAFTNAGGISANYIAKWNGSDWSALGSGMNNIVTALAVSGTDLYATGGFTTAGGNPASVARWNGNSWTGLGSVNGLVYALAVSDGTLYVAGDFSLSGASIAKWNGSFWSGVGSAMNGDVYALAVSGMDVYAGGYFTTAGGSTAKNIAKWNGSSWGPLG